MVIAEQNDKVIHRLLQQMCAPHSGPWLTPGDELWNLLMVRRAETGEIPTALWLVAGVSTLQGYIEAEPVIRIRNGVVHFSPHDLENLLDYVMVGINLLFENVSSHQLTESEVAALKRRILGNYKMYDHLAGQGASKKIIGQM